MTATFEPLIVGTAARSDGERSMRPAILPDFSGVLHEPETSGPEAISSADLRDAFEAGRREGAEAARLQREARAAQALEGIRSALATAEAAAVRAADDTLTELARTLFTMADSALPGAARRNAPVLIRAFVEQMGQEIRLHPEATVRVAPSLVPLLSRDLPLRVEGDLSIPEGDASVSWSGGGALLDLAARRAALREALGLLDLLEDRTP